MAFPTPPTAVYTAPHFSNCYLNTIFLMAFYTCIHKYAGQISRRWPPVPRWPPLLAYTLSAAIGSSWRMVKLKKLPTSPNQRAKVARSSTPHDAAVEAQLKMPNERDESVAMTPAEPDPVMQQAATDVARGLQDTTSGAELNRAYKKLK